MTNWEIFNDTAREWDNLLLRAHDCSIFQSYSWGEYKRLSGWTPLRFVGRDSSKNIISMCQFTVKDILLGHGIAWAAGGPVVGFDQFQSKSSRLDLTSLLSYFNKYLPRYVVRFNYQEQYDTSLSYAFNKYCNRSITKINSGFSVIIKLSGIDNNFFNSMTSKHRYYVKKAMSQPFIWRYGSEASHLAVHHSVHSSMVSLKNLSSIGVSFDSLNKLHALLGDDKIFVLNGYLHEEPVTSCLVYNFGDKSFYASAATNLKGRNVSAAYAMLPKLLQILESRGVKNFDFGGIDPSRHEKNGVNHFKIGFGGNLIEYLGEWEHSSSNLSKYLINFAVSKHGSKQ